MSERQPPMAGVVLAEAGTEILFILERQAWFRAEDVADSEGRLYPRALLLAECWFEPHVGMRSRDILFRLLDADE